MKFFRLDLLTLLISLFILNSCKNQSTIGLGATQLNGNLIDTSTIVINTVPDDSVATNALAATPLSYMKDPLFGTTEANLAIDLNLPSSLQYTLPAGTISVDSALLVLRFAPGFYGDSIASRYKANVYQLNERLYSNATYYNTKKWSYNSGTLLGSKSFFSRTHDSIKIVNPVSGGPDTAVKVPAQLRIPISTAFINSILFNASSTQLSSNLVFKNNVHGLYITLDKNQTGLGGTFMFALDSAAAIQIYYKNVDGSTIDTAVVALSSTLHAAEIKHTYSSTIQSALASTQTSSTAIYFQGLSGLRAKISFPYLKNIVKSLGSDVVLNRAELVITPSPGSGIPFSPLPRLTMYKYDLARQRVSVQDASTTDPRSFGVGDFGGFYSATQNEYHFLITAYIQDLMRGTTANYGTTQGTTTNVDYGTYIGSASTDISTVPIAATAQVDGRTFAIGTDKTSPYRIKLNIIYTKIPK